MIIFPNAKINIGLNILEKLPDGYHSIQSIFVPIGLYDILEFIPCRKKSSIAITGLSLDAKPQENIVYKAWQLFRDRYKIDPVTICLHKNIPAGAGMGGGSSDAASMLCGLNNYFKCELDIRELEQMAGELGSDCVFFIRNKPALVSGRGEKIEPVDVLLTSYKFILINPGIHISTHKAYSAVTPVKNQENPAILMRKPVNTWQANISNDFEKSVFSKYPEIKIIKEKLIELGAGYASMSGSGSSVYGIFKEEADISSITNLFVHYFIWEGRALI